MNTRGNVAGMKRRYFEVDNLRIDENGEGKMPTIVGHAAVFNQMSKPIKTKSGEFVETIKPGAFKKTLESGSEIMSLRQHDPKSILARLTAQTLKAWEDDKGLAFSFVPANTTAGRDTVEDIRSGNIKGCSFGFDDPPPGGEKWERINGQMVHTLTEIPLKEISVTGFPAYEGTSLDLRSEERAIEDLNRAENERGQTPGYSSIASACRSTMGQCRSTWDAVQSTKGMMDDLEEGTLSDGEASQVRDMHQQMQHLSDQLTACMRSCEPHLMTSGERSRSRLLAFQTRQRFAEIGRTATPEELENLRAHFRSGHMTHNEGVPALNDAAVKNAESLIAAGKINNGTWTFTADEEAAMLGNADWTNYGKWHLGTDKNADQKSRDAYKYPFGKAGEVYVNALRAVRSLASQQKATAINDAAGKLLDAINAKQGKSDAA